MKTKQFALAILALVLTASASATKIPQMNIVALDDSKALLSAVIDDSSNSEISIQDEAGNIVYYKESKASVGISYVFNLRKLENGFYTFKVKTGTASASREVVIQNGKLEVQETKTQLEPYFAIDGNILKVSYLNFDGQDMSLHIYEGDNQVYESGLGNPFVVQKGLNVSDLNNGSYQVVLATENEVYSYDLGR
ncbi:MAG TPA: hypothetical protein PK335_03950 [Draconibacterium sp.]|nr:hypothetical protein [Draconibacterium sp.]